MTVQVQGDSQEAVAFGLMQCVLLAAGRGNHDHPFPAGSTLLRGQDACSERDILALFSRCLRVVQGHDPNMLTGQSPTAPIPARSPREAVPLHA